MLEIQLPGIPEQFKLTPEFQLLAACSWIAPPMLEQEQADKIAALCLEINDWHKFVSLAKRHGLHALAYESLKRCTGDFVPQYVKVTIRERNAAERLQALYQIAELVRLVKLFAGHGIDLIPLKGVFLSDQLYGDPGMRSSVDLDILAKEEHIDYAQQIFEAEGYGCEYHGMKLTARQKQEFRIYLPHFDFTHGKSGLHVELHWNFGLWLPEQMTAFMKHTTRREWQGISVVCLDDDATLLLLCEHGSRHLWSSLKWLGDVARLISSERPAGWESLIRLAAEFDLRRILAHSALLVHWVYGISLPREICVLVQQESLARPLSYRVLEKLQMSAEVQASRGKRAQKLRETLYMKHLRPSLPYRLLLNYCLVSPDDYQIISLPDSMFWLYYPLRPILWFWRNYIKS